MNGSHGKSGLRPTLERLAIAGSSTREDEGLDIVAVRFEDMHARTRDLVSAVARHLEIPWDDTLLESTQDGIPYVFRRDDGSFISGIDPSIPGRQGAPWCNQLDKWRIRHSLAGHIAEWGYAPAPRLLTWAMTRCKWFLRLFLVVPMRMEMRILRRLARENIEEFQRYRRRRADFLARLSDPTSRTDAKPISLLSLADKD
jgi:hypothetical protein